MCLCPCVIFSTYYICCSELLHGINIYQLSYYIVYQIFVCESWQLTNQVQKSYVMLLQATISLLFLYDLIHNCTTISFDDYFTFNSTITRSHSKMLMTKCSSINAYRFSFFVNIVFLWNSLPVSVCNLNSRKVFCWGCSYRLYLLLSPVKVFHKLIKSCYIQLLHACCNLSSAVLPKHTYNSIVSKGKQLLYCLIS